MVDGDLFREVEEEMRKERAVVFWNRYGTLIVAGALGIIIGVSGWKYWEYSQAKTAATAGALFEGAVVLEQDGKSDEARKALEDLSKDGPKGYRSLALFRLAGDLAKNGKTAEAVTAYDKLATGADADQSLATFAKVRSAMLRVDDATFDEMNERLSDLTGGSTPWRHTARELLGLSAYKNGKKAEAEKIFQEILVDSGATSALRQRAQVMLSLLVEPEKQAAAQETKAATEDKTPTANAPAAQN